MAEMVSRIYSNFRGVDFRGEEINLVRSPDSLNVWKDYKETESIRTRPGMELLRAFTEPVYGIYFYDGRLIVHSGKSLYRRTGEVWSTLSSDMDASPSDGFVYENKWYFKDKTHYMVYDGSSFKSVEEDAFIPTTSIGRKPEGGGTIYQDINFLTGWRINTFLADGKSFDFYLDTKDIDPNHRPIVKVDDKVVDSGQYDVHYDLGIIEFLHEAPDAPGTDGRDNVSVQFYKEVDGYKEIILNCTMLQVFDNRVFFSGNPKYPNVVYHCSLNDPSYWSDLDYYREGMDDSPVRGLVAGNNALWAFREASDANTNVFYHTPTIDEEYGKVYPSSHSSITIGCVGKAINFNDDIVFFSERGMEGISGDITTEQVAAHRSSLVDRKMIAESNYKNMILAEWEGYLLVFIGNKVYLADSRTAFTYENHIEYDWFYWELEKEVTSVKVHDGVLYLGTKDGLYTLTDYKANVESYWTTPKDKFKYPHMQKTTNKKSCTVEAEGKEISVYAKTNRDKEWELLGTFAEVDDAFSLRIKVKKFKDIQMKFYSPKQFSLESATLECFIGGYLKNL